MSLEGFRVSLETGTVYWIQVGDPCRTGQSFPAEFHGPTSCWSKATMSGMACRET